MHGERNFIFIRKTVNRLVNLFNGICPIGCIKTRILRQIQMIEIFCFVDDGLASDNLTVIIHENIMHNRKNPAFEVYILIIFLSVVQYTKCCFLQQIFGFFPVSGQC